MGNLVPRQFVNRLLLALCVVLTPPLSAADDSMTGEIRALFAAGAWEQALTVLRQTPNSQTDPKLRELLAMAYLYTSNRLDSAGNLGQAGELSKQIIESGGKAHFLVSRGRDDKNVRDDKKETHLLEATPGELVVSAADIEFQPVQGYGLPPSRWEKSQVTGCAPNRTYGNDSHSFHLLAGSEEVNFRPLHFSAEESTLICSLIVPGQPAAGTPAGAGTNQANRDQKKPKSKEKAKKGEDSAH